jgi:signal peptidase I
MLEANVSSAHLHLTSVRVAGARLLQAACALVLLVLIAGLCAALIPRPFGFRPAVVTSGSMGHSIPVGSLAMTHAVGAGAIREGDVILVQEEANGVQARPKLHRVVAVEHENANILVSTKGDANDAPDPNLYVLPARVDVVAYSMPYLGYLVGFMLTPAGWVLAVGLPGALVCAFVLRRIWASDDASRSAERSARGFLREGGAAAKRAIEHENRGREGLGIMRLAHTLIPRVPRPSLVTIAVALVAITASTVAAAGYVMAPRPTTSDDGGRLAREAISLTQHSARLATGDGYAADLLVLRDADDPAVLAPDRPAREAALSGLLAGASNVFDALAVIDPAGEVIASSDPAIVDVHASKAFLIARANGGVASSVDGPADSSPGRVDYAAPLRAPDGSLAGVLFARAAAARLWAPTLETTVDRSRNVIVDGDGKLIAGGAPDALGRAWSAAPARLGGLHASIDGVPSVCGSSAIGEGTHLDLGWRVASCLPDSLATTENTPSMRRYRVSIVAVVASTVLVATIVLYAVARRERDRSRRRETLHGLETIEARLQAREA